MNLLSLKLRNKTPKEEACIGIDIGTFSIKALKLNFLKDGTLELAGYKVEPAVVDPAPVLKKIAQSLDAKKINLSISGPASIIRYVAFPNMNPDEFKQALKFEAQRYIPFSVSDVSIDSYILKNDLPDNKMLVLLAAAKNEFISQRLKLAEEAELKVNLIDIDSIALINAFKYNYLEKQEKTSVALFNIGASTSNLNILENGLPRLSRDIHIAGNNFTQRISEIIGVDFKSAEDLKLNPDKERAAQVSAIIESVLSNLAVELRTSFDYYETQCSNSVSKIYLSGSGSLLAGLKDKLVNLLGMETEYWDPLRKISLPSNHDLGNIKSLSAQFGVAVGLALRK